MTMTVSEQVEKYVSLKHGLGLEIVTDASMLKQLPRFADETGHEGPIDLNLAVAWARNTDAGDLYIAKRYELARRVCDLSAVLDSECPKIPPGLMGRCRERVTPYIYTDEEMILLMHAASEMYAQRDKLKPLALQFCIGLMRSTGMRPCEVLALEDSDFDAESGIITVVKSKSGRRRILPLEQSVVDAVRSYRAERERLRTDGTCTRLIIGSGSKPMGVASIEKPFEVLRMVLLERGETWRRRPPRAYDLRHTFAVRTILRWHAEDRDVNAMLPVLANYMGHVSVTETYWYLTGAPELMSVAAIAFEEAASWAVTR